MGGNVINPPEELVFGAKLRCTQSLNPSFLFFFGDRKTTSGLPAACVLDRVPGENIQPFGTCQCGFFATNPCETAIMQPAPKWENPEPQNESIDGEEIITTSSVLVCDLFSGRITAVNSGQDGVIWKQFLFIQELMGDFPELFEVLRNPYSSIYTPNDVHDQALALLDKIISSDMYGGSVFLMGQDGNDLLGPLILGSIGQLVPSAGVGDPSALLTGMECMITRNGGSYNVDPHYLDKDLLNIIRRDSEWYSGEVAKGGAYRLQEENKLLLSFLAESITTIAYAAVIYASAHGASNRRGTNQEDPRRFEPTSKLEAHIKNTDPTVPRSRGIGGAHNSVEFFKNDVRVVRTTKTSIPGVSVVEYNMPRLNPNGTPTGGYGRTIFSKTIYDPLIVGDSVYVSRGIQAANNAALRSGGVMSREWTGVDNYGVTWRGYYTYGEITSFFPQ